VRCKYGGRVDWITPCITQFSACYGYKKDECRLEIKNAKEQEFL
jgi:hypothetical protein